MNWKYLLVFLIIMFSNTVHGYDEEISILFDSVHIGTEQKNWEKVAFYPEYKKNFSIYSKVNNATLVFETFDVHYSKNPIKLNGNPLNPVCTQPLKHSWHRCEISIPPAFIHMGENQLRFLPERDDDYMIRQVTVKLSYHIFQPKLIVEKVVLPEEPSVGEETQVSIQIANIGKSPAYNVTIMDFINPDFKILNGTSKIVQTKLEGGRSFHHIYYVTTGIPQETRFPAARIFFQNSSGIKFEETSNTVVKKIKPGRPKISINITPLEVPVSVGEQIPVELSLSNNGVTRITDVKTVFILPSNSIMLNWSGKNNIDLLNPEDTKKIIFLLTFNETFDFMTRIQINFTENYVNSFSVLSDEIHFKSLTNETIESVQDSSKELLLTKILGFVMLLILVLFVFLFIVRERH